MDYWSEMGTVIPLIDKKNIGIAALKIENTQSLGGRLFLAGNGGSAATAEHASVDLSKGISLKSGKKFSTVCINSNISKLTAWSNDFSYENAFEEMLKLDLTVNDLFLSISGSGNSQNILNAIQYAKSLGAFTIGLTGFSGGAVSKLVDLEINIPSSDMQIIENMHLSVIHSIYKLIE